MRLPASAGTETWRHGYGITKVGVMLDELIAADRRPRTLFEADREKQARLMRAMDEVNGRFGKFTSVPAIQGLKRAWSWSARSESRSPDYTTRLSNVRIVRA